MCVSVCVCAAFMRLADWSTFVKLRSKKSIYCFIVLLLVLFSLSTTIDRQFVCEPMGQRVRVNVLVRVSMPCELFSYKVGV